MYNPFSFLALLDNVPVFITGVCESCVLKTPFQHSGQSRDGEPCSSFFLCDTVLNPIYNWTSFSSVSACVA